MTRAYLPIVILTAIAIVFLVVSFIASALLGPKRRTMAKTAPYECGIVPEEGNPQRFNVKFYLIAIAFILLDVEIIFLYPFSTIYVDRIIDGVKEPGLGAAGLAAMGIFLFIALIPFAYLLSSGALNFGPSTPKIHSLLKPIVRSEGFSRSESETESGEVVASGLQEIEDNNGS